VTFKRRWSKRSPNGAAPVFWLMVQAGARAAVR
jgi:hypothetical protein